MVVVWHKGKGKENSGFMDVNSFGVLNNVGPRVVVRMFKMRNNYYMSICVCYSSLSSRLVFYFSVTQALEAEFLKSRTSSHRRSMFAMERGGFFLAELLRLFGIVGFNFFFFLGGFRMRILRSFLSGLVKGMQEALFIEYLFCGFRVSHNGCRLSRWRRV